MREQPFKLSPELQWLKDHHQLTKEEKLAIFYANPQVPEVIKKLHRALGKELKRRGIKP